MGGGDHFAGAVGDFDQEVVDFLEVWGGHCGRVAGVVGGGEAGEGGGWVVGVLWM